MAYNVYFCCDKCGDTYSWVNTPVGITYAERLARNKGWQVGRKGWFCPSCRTTKRRGE